jgi:type IV secretory pathway TraG/TraD family ATPase VirD4
MSHWDKASTKIMGSLFLAAAIGGLTIIDCYRFVMSPEDTRPVDILEADGRFPLEAQALDAYARTTERQRAGEYASAKTALQFVGYASVRKWITPTPGRTEFRPSMMFDHDAPTLYLLSQEGEGSTGPLTAALTIAVYEAGVQEALRHGGRLPVPMMMVLDEVANVCRWEALPDLYTHMGGRGILPIALLQSYPQGKQVWGEERMAQLLSNSSIFVAGGNTKGDGYHQSIVNMVKKTPRLVTSTSASRQGASTSTSEQMIDTIDIADVRELPKEYSLLFVGGTAAMVLRHVPVWKRGFKKKPARETTPQTSAPVDPYTAPTDQPRRARKSSGWALTLEEDHQ